MCQCTSKCPRPALVCLTLSDPGGGPVGPPPSVNPLPMLYGWEFQLQHLMVFQAEGIDIVYKSQFFHLLSIL